MALKKAGKSPGIYQNTLADGEIVYYYSYKDSLGKKHNVKVGNKSAGITATFAKNKRDERLNLLRLGEDPKAGKKKIEKIPFNDVWKLYIDNSAMGDRTRKERRKRYTNHMESYFNPEPTVDNLKRFRADKEKNLSPVTVDMMLAMVGTAINYWNKRQRRNRRDGKPFLADVENPVPHLREDDTDDRTKDQHESTTVQRDRYLTLDEVKLLKDRIKDEPELDLFVHLALCTGARLGTLMTIKKRDIADGEVKLRNHKASRDYTGFIDEATQKLLDKKWKSLKANDLVISLESRQVQRRVQWRLDKLFNEGLGTKDSVNRAVVHTLRHTFASHLVINGTSLAQVQKLMDHKKIETTMIYAHLGKDGGREAVKRLWS